MQINNFVECKRCKREFLVSDLADGYCESCLEELGLAIPKSVESNSINSKNPIASQFQTYKIIMIILCIIGGVCIIVILQNYLLGIATILSFIPIALICNAVSEHLQLLEDIKNKLK